jgi:hypothetical protein
VERDAAEGAANGEGAVGRGKGGRGARRRARGAEMQQASFAFAADTALAGDVPAEGRTQPAVPPDAGGRA